MGFKLSKLFFCSFLVLLFSISFTYSNVEVFSSYNTILKVNSNNTIDISKDLTIKNVYSVGIVPGQVEFKIGKSTDGSISNLKINNVRAIDRFGNIIPTRVRTTNTYTKIILDVYYPLLPGFEYKFKLDYTINYQPGGLFFKSLQIPLRESTIPIEKGDFKVVLPKNFYFTYLSSESNRSKIVDNYAIWKIANNAPKFVTFEYSYLPIKISSFKGSYVFWLLINFILLLFLLNGVRKEVKRLKKLKEGEVDLDFSVLNDKIKEK